jgi:DNA-binding MarR family transcriptional regulator
MEENSLANGTDGTDGTDGLPIVGLLGRAYAHTTSPVYASVAAVAPEIRPRHGNVMEHLDNHDGLRLTDLAEASGLAPQSVQVLVDQLETLGYVERRPDPHDRRAKRIWRTDRARRASQAATDAVHVVDQRIVASLGQARYTQLRTALRDILTIDLHSR